MQDNRYVYTFMWRLWQKALWSNKPFQEALMISKLTSNLHGIVDQCGDSVMAMEHRQRQKNLKATRL